MPSVPWLGMNFAFPLFQEMLLRAWSEEEVAILEQFSHTERDLVLAQQTLADAGFKRSLRAIFSKRKRKWSSS